MQVRSLERLSDVSLDKIKQREQFFLFGPQPGRGKSSRLFCSSLHLSTHLFISLSISHTPASHACKIQILIFQTLILDWPLPLLSTCLSNYQDRAWVPLTIFRLRVGCSSLLVYCSCAGCTPVLSVIRRKR